MTRITGTVTNIAGNPRIAVLATADGAIHSLNAATGASELEAHLDARVVDNDCSRF